jgi:hypothetical protein
MFPHTFKTCPNQIKLETINDYIKIEIKKMSGGIEWK